MVVGSAAATLAAKKVTQTVPIVMVTIPQSLLLRTDQVIE